MEAFQRLIRSVSGTFRVDAHMHTLAQDRFHSMIAFFSALFTGPIYQYGTFLIEEIKEGDPVK
jgi:hypothetical protein